MTVCYNKKAATLRGGFLRFLFRVRLIPDGFYFFDDFGIGRAGCDDVRKFFSFNSEFLQELSVSGSRIDVVTDAASQFGAGFICYAR